MKIMTCPMNGPRNINEFSCFGPAHANIDIGASSDDVWSHHLFYIDNTAGVIREWWRHNPSNFFFIAERNTLTDEIVETYAASKLSFNEIDR